jgi:hypothetical protein
MRVFVTYRRVDSAAYAGRLHDALVEEFGEDNVFQDVSAIVPGEDFTAAIDAALDEADAVLVVIGPNWLSPGPSGSPRLHEENDYVRIEISKALARGIRVVPLLVGRASLPSATQLLEDLVPLSHRQAVELRDTTWHQDVAALIGSLQGKPRFENRRWWTIAGISLGFILWGVNTGERSQGFVGYTVSREPEQTLGLVVALASGVEGTIQIELSP